MEKCIVCWSLWYAIITITKGYYSEHYSGPMGVSAVFVSALALKELPRPHNPPQDHPELLAACLEPMIAFVVLSSILIRESLLYPHPGAIFPQFHRWSLNPIHILFPVSPVPDHFSPCPTCLGAKLFLF